MHLWIPLVDIDETRACIYVDPFDAFFTYDPSLMRMVHPDNRRVRTPRATASALSSPSDDER